MSVARAPAARPAEPARVAETVPSGTVSASRSADGHAPFSASHADARVSTLLAPRVQRETRVSSPSDPAEREAVATARKVMRMTAPPPAPSTTGAASSRPGLNASPLLRVSLHRSASAAPALHRSAAAAPPSVLHRAPAAAPKPRAAAALPRADDVMPEIRSEMGGGTPLPPSVRGFLEPRFRAGFGAVRIHTGEKAAGIAARLAARAFTFGKHVFFGRGEYRPSDPEGMELIAHELTHTIQQKEVVQRQEDVTVSERSEPAVQRLGFDDLLDWIADRANAIPGFRMFTIVLGVNPVNMSPVDRSPANILRAVVEFIPGGNLITRALDTYGIFDRVGNWISAQIRGLGMVGSAFKSALTQFIGTLGLRDLVRPGSVWDRARRIFTEPIDRLKNFAAGFIGGILDFLREAVLRPIARLAEGTPAYPLLKAVLGRDPVTGEPVPQDADALIGGFMTLIGQQEVYENVKRGNAVARALAWFKGTLAGVLGFVRAVPGLIVSTFRSITLDDVLPITNLFVKVGRAFGGFVGSFLSWGLGQVLGLLQIVIEVVAPSVMPYVRRAAGAFQQIVRNPMGFMGNLIRAGVQGFRQFGGNFLAHLRRSLIGWLTGTMAGAAIYVPQALNLREVIKFVLSVLGLTWQNIRQKLVRVVGETAVAAMEQGFAIVRTLVTQGPAAAWEQIREGIGNLQEMVMGQVMTFVRNRVVQAAITTLASSLIPGAGFIRAIIAIYDTVTFFVQRLRQIGAVVAAYIDSIAAIAAGNIGSAANRVETTMAGMLTLVISFLAQIARLGNVSAAVVGIINRVRAPIDRALDRVVAWIVAQVRRLGSMVGGRDARSPAEKQRDLDRAVRELRPRIEALLRRGLPRPLLMARLLVWRTQYRLTSLTVEGTEIRAAINPMAPVTRTRALAIGAQLEPILRAAEAAFMAQMRSESQRRVGRAVERWEGGLAARARLGPGELAAAARAARRQRIALEARGQQRIPQVLAIDADVQREGWEMRIGDRSRRDQGTGRARTMRDFYVPNAPNYWRMAGRVRYAYQPGGTIAAREAAVTDPMRGLRDYVEPARGLGNLPASQVALGLAQSSGATEQERFQRGGVTEADITIPETPVLRPRGAVVVIGGGAPMAGGNTSAATDLDFPRSTSAQDFTQAQLDQGRDVRLEAYGRIFETLRQVLNNNPNQLVSLESGGGEALRDVAVAFRDWLRIALPQGRQRPGTSGEIAAAATTLAARLTTFLQQRLQR